MKHILMLLDNGYKPDVRVKKEIDTLTKLGLNIALICWDQDTDLQELESRNNIVIHRLKIPAANQEGIKKIFKLFKFYYQLVLLIKNKNISTDYIYVHDLLLLPIGVFLKLKKKKQLIYDAHEIYHLMEWEKYNFFVRRIIFLIERLGIKFTDFFIVVSENRREFYSRYVKKNIIVLGNWFDKYEGNEEDLCEALNIPSESLIFAYLGTLNLKARKLDEVINWTKKIDNSHIVFAGTGSDQNLIEKIASSDDRIHYLGWIPNVRKYLNNVDYIYYFLDKDRIYFNYAAPNTIFLCISHEIPLITNVCGEPKTLIERHNIGYFVEDETEIESSKLNFDKFSFEYQTKVENIKKIKEKYSWNQSANIYNQIFKL